MENERIESCPDFEPRYEFSLDADWWKKGITYSDVLDRPDLMPVLSPSPIEKEFKERADRWEKETAIHSSPGAKFIHKDLMYILTRGEAVIPLVLKRLRTSGSDWFWVLEQFAQEDIARDSKDFESAVQAWSEWWAKMRSIKQPE